MHFLIFNITRTKASQREKTRTPEKEMTLESLYTTFTEKGREMQVTSGRANDLGKDEWALRRTDGRL